MNKNLIPFLTFIAVFNISFLGLSAQNDTLDARKIKQKADSLSALNLTDSASFYYILSADKFKQLNLSDEELGCMKLLAICHLNNEENPDSTLRYANKLLERAKEIYGDTSRWIVDAYIIIAFPLSDLALYNKSIESLNMALRIAPSIYPYYHVKTGLIYGNLGINYHHAGNYKESIDCYYKALDIDRTLFGEEHQTMATNYNNLGITYADIGLTDSAIFFYKKALIIWEKLYGTDHIALSDNYTNLAVESLSKGDYYQAILYENSSLRLRLMQFGEEHKATALCYSNLGVYYEFAHDYTKALEYQKKALDIRLKVLPDNHPMLASSYINIASLLRNQQKYDEALIYQEKALAINIAVYGEINYEVAQVMDYIGDIYRKQNKYKLSLQTYSEAIKIDRKSFNTLHHPKIADLYINRAKTFIDMALYDSAIADLNKAIFSNCEIDNPEKISDELNPEYYYSETILLNALFSKGKSLYLKYLSYTTNRNILEESYNVHLQAISLMDKVKQSYSSEETKMFFADNISEIFRRTIDIAYKLYATTGKPEYTDRIFWLIEKSKSGILYENLTLEQIMRNSNIPDSLLLQEKFLSTEINTCRLWIAQSEVNPMDSTKKETTVLQNELIGLQNKHTFFITNLENKYPKFKLLNNKADLTTISRIQSILDTNTLMVDYFISDSSLYNVALKKDTMLLTCVAIDSGFKEKLVVYLKSIKTYDAEKFSLLSTALFNYLVSPLSGLLAGNKHLIILPDKYLFHLPFETLCQGAFTGTDFTNADYLIKHNDIKYHYSASLYAKSLTRLPGNPIQENSFVGFAPIFKDNAASNYILAYKSVDDSINVSDVLRSVSVDGRMLNELIYSEKELTDIYSVFSGYNFPAKLYLSSEAQEKTFRENSGKYKYVHIASHGILNDSIPKLSGLVFAQPELEYNRVGQINESNSGILYGGEAQNLALNADLLVLSACETGTGKILEGEGVMSLSHSFLSTGVPNIVFSLWKVGDKSTMQLMVSFYSNFLSGSSYSEALQKAKLDLISDKRYAFPKYWGAFALIGIN